MRAVIYGLFSRLGAGPEGAPGDDDLLAAYLAARDARAFEAIVRRHGPMVHGVCRRVLGNEADADDAFQATFLVLVRKADSVRPRSMLGNWLYGVAVNVARKARELAARRREKEMRAAEHRVRNDDAPGSDAGLAAVLDQELGRLPAVYRAAVVACDLEGQTRKEAAGRLGWSEGTVASRLARGRALLADRLTRRGVAVPAAGVAAVAGVGSTAGATVPPEVLHQLVAGGGSAAADELARWAVRAMTAGKLRTAGVVLAAVGAAGIGTAVALASVVGEQSPAPERTAGPKVAITSGTKPAAAPVAFVLTNPAKDITVVSDRGESFVEFFRRQKLLVGSLPRDRVAALLAATAPTDRTFVTTASYNEPAVNPPAYGASVRIAPPVTRAAAVSKPVADLLTPLATATRDDARPLWLIFRPDATEPDLWHVVGFTTRAKAAEAGFFLSGERVGPDEFAPAELIDQSTKKPK